MPDFFFTNELVVIISLLLQSTSSTESDSMPFANDNAGTIKQRSARAHPALAALTYSSSAVAAVMSPSMARRAPTTNTNLGQHCTSVS